MSALLELRSQLRQLQWYGEVNRRGFVKITKKLDKKIPGERAQQRYLASKVDTKAFAHNLPLSQDMKAINEWLSSLGEAKTFDDTGSAASVASLGRAPARSLNLSPATLEAVDQAIKADNSQALTQALAEVSSQHDISSKALQQLLLNFLQRSISCRAKTCIDRLLPDIESLEEEDDVNKRNCIHRLIIAIGRSNTEKSVDINGAEKVASPNNTYIVPAAPPHRAPAPYTTKEDGAGNLLTKNDETVRLLIYLLDRLQPRQRAALHSRDARGRLPLHYAAQYGFVVVCQVVMEYMQEWGQFDVSEGIDSPYWQDNEGYAPLHLAVIGGHPLTTKTLLQAENWQGENDELQSRKKFSKSGAVLLLATQSNFVAIVKLLVEAGVDVNYQDAQGETALHVAARFGHEECAKALVEGSIKYKTDVNIPEKTFGWTPLFVACVDGHLSVVEVLIAAGAALDYCDLSGWTAKEHAALRGHIRIAERLAQFTPNPSPPPSVSSERSTSPQTSSLEERRSKHSAKDAAAAKTPEPVKTFGHRYLTKETMILVSLGSMDMRKDIPAVKLDNIPIADAHATQLDTALSIVVTATGATGESEVIDLPVQDNISTEPITFMTDDATKVKLLFDIFPTYSGSPKNQIVGRGVALLSSVKPSVGSQRMSLQGDVSVPIVAASTLDVIGSVNFNFLIIKPFSHPNMVVTEDHTYWKKMASTMVIGHRGLGKNTNARTSLQLGENTIESFIAAANLGASYVEFDVQLTKDHVPVIYHDFLVSETGIDAPVHTLTLEQFLHVSEGQTPRQSRPTSPQPKIINGAKGPRNTLLRGRSYSVDNTKQKNIHAAHSKELSERMKHTRDFKMKGYKGNSRGNFIQAPFTTLEEMFKKLPEDTGFNIEMKYPMLHETEEHEMDQYAVELNSFVDTVLKTVYDLAGKRRVIFSSFNPDVCLMLSFKQPSIPILFLTDAGTYPVGDIRAASLQEAIRFASRWNLLGVVSAAEPLVLCPRLVRVVKASGLVCVSYGTLNNDPKNVKVRITSLHRRSNLGSC
jgi:glycerophosphodiester phosphodiesterase